MSELNERVEKLLEKKDAAGAPLYSDADIKDALPLLCAEITREIPEIQFPEYVLASVGEVAQKAGVTEDSKPEEIWKMIDAYYSANPSILVQELRGILQLVGSLDGAEKAEALASVIGATSSKKPLDSGKRPEGTVPAGPAARFAAMGFDEKK